MFRITMLISLCFMVGCQGTGNGFKNTPPLKEGETIIWNYVCAKSGLFVEYANFNGSYTAKVFLPENEKRVLEQVGKQNLFVLDNMKWFSENGGYFSLMDGDDVIFSQCVAREALRSGAIQLNFNRD